MDIRIGLIDSPQTLDLELPSKVKAADVKKQVEKALSGDESHIWLEDKDGNELAVATSKISFVRLGTSEERKIGFG